MQHNTLTNERKVLVRNISTIYRTAVLELERKSAEIKGLRSQLAEVCPTYCLCGLEFNLFNKL